MKEKKALAVATGIALELVVLAYLGAQLGEWLDTQWDSGGLGVPLMVGIGFAAWVVHLLVIARGMEDKKDPHDS